MSKLEKALAIVLASMLVVIVSGTTYGALTSSRAKKLARQTVPIASGEAIFDGLGRIRVSTADDPPAIAVIDLAFPYPASDRQFHEELQHKRLELRTAAHSFFSSRKAGELRPDNESAIKAALRDTLNSMLTLGSIETLYFSEFQVID